MTKRVLAHLIVRGDRQYTMSVASAVCDPDGKWSVTVEPFSVETPGTTFVSGTVYIEDAEGAPFRDGDTRPPVFRH